MNVSSIWSPYVNAAVSQWNAGSATDHISFTEVAGSTTPSTCAPVFGTVQVCSGAYGFNGWLGYENYWVSGGFIVMATVRYNDSYFANAKYNTPAWREMTACHELGHSLGLAHNDEIKTDANNGSCMDYTSNPAGGGALGILRDIQPASFDFLGLNAIYAGTDPSQLTQTMAGNALAVPEPSIWALMIAGFGLVGSGMRRRSAPMTAVLA